MYGLLKVHNSFLHWEQENVTIIKEYPNNVHLIISFASIIKPENLILIYLDKTESNN